MPFPIGFHPVEILILIAVGLLLLAPKKLPQITSGIGKSIRGFKKEFSANKEQDPEPKEIEE